MLEADLERAEERGEEKAARKDELEQELEEAKRTIKNLENERDALEGTLYVGTMVGPTFLTYIKKRVKLEISSTDHPFEALDIPPKRADTEY